MALVIKTDHKWKQFRYRDEVPPKVLAAWFDWTDETDGFFYYHRTWYHVSQFMSGGPDGWHGIHHESFSTGVLLRLSSDGESYQVGTYRATSDL